MLLGRRREFGGESFPNFADTVHRFEYEGKPLRGNPNFEFASRSRFGLRSTPKIRIVYKSVAFAATLLTKPHANIRIRFVRHVSILIFTSTICAIPGIRAGSRMTWSGPSRPTNSSRLSPIPTTITCSWRRVRWKARPRTCRLQSTSSR